MPHKKDIWSGGLPLAAIGGVFVLSVAIVAINMHFGDHTTTLQLLVLAGLIVQLIDRHVKNRVVEQKIDENTSITAEAKEKAAQLTTKINGRMDELIAYHRSDAFERGRHQGASEVISQLQSGGMKITPSEPPKSDEEAKADAAKKSKSDKSND